jgi:hypothetical protein
LNASMLTSSIFGDVILLLLVSPASFSCVGYSFSTSRSHNRT